MGDIRKVFPYSEQVGARLAGRALLTGEGQGLSVLRAYSPKGSAGVVGPVFLRGMIPGTDKLARGYLYAPKGSAGPTGRLRARALAASGGGGTCEETCVGRGLHAEVTVSGQGWCYWQCPYAFLQVFGCCDGYIGHLWGTHCSLSGECGMPGPQGRVNLVLTLDTIPADPSYSVWLLELWKNVGELIGGEEVWSIYRVFFKKAFDHSCPLPIGVFEFCGSDHEGTPWIVGDCLACLLEHVVVEVDGYEVD